MLGIFDSGIGGLTVASAIRRLSLSADFVYFGDLANMPFGEKSEAELLAITKHAIRFLIDHGATEIVAACNSVSLLASGLRSECSVPIIEMSEPTVRMFVHDHPQPLLVKEGSSQCILIAATEATVRSKLYEDAFLKKGMMTASIVIPELASAIEQDASRDELRTIILPSIDRAIASSSTTFILGCTQYPFARRIFEELFRERDYSIEVFDPAEAVAAEVVNRFSTSGNGSQTFFTSRSSDVFDAHVRNLFGSSETTRIV